MNRLLEVVTAYAASIVRLGAGRTAHHPVTTRPVQPLELYEFEACPFCRVVREALSELDLPATIHPCPRGGRNRATVIARGGKAQFPFLVDPGRGVEMYESRDIVSYLERTYGGRAPRSLGLLTNLSSTLASATRPGRGRKARASKIAALPLTLYSFEVSPFCRLVRERLCELELTYELVNVAKRSPSRAAFVAKSGRMRVPYLVDPNTGSSMFESADIVAYLERTYAA